MLASLLAFAVLAPQTVSLVPKQTVWVYANASSPTDGTFLRAWGAGGKSCPGEGEDVGDFSYSYLKWDLSEVPADARIVSAKLELANIPDPGFSLDMSRKAPLEVRAIDGDFDAKTWTFGLAGKVRPSIAKTGIFGDGYAKEIKAGVPVVISVDLMKTPGAFEKALKSALNSTSHMLSLSITSALDPSVDGRSCVYKVYGEKESKESLRPQLTLTLER